MPGACQSRDPASQNRTAAFGLVDNFGLSLCWVLILFRMGLLFFYSEGVERERE